MSELRACDVDLYAVLEVDRAASEKDIRQAYKRLALRFHPDKSREADAEVGSRARCMMCRNASSL